MKVGDIVYCKKNYSNIKKGERCKIKNIIGDKIFIEYGGSHWYIFGYIFDSSIIHNYNSDGYQLHYYYEYFLSDSEIRKLKLEKINESSL